jgi:hypothetical protein
MRPLRCALCLLPLLLVLSTFASADQIPYQDAWYFGNTGGTLTFNPTTGTLTLTSTLTTIIAGTTGNDLGLHTGDFGTVTVTTGPLISGSVNSHGWFGTATLTIMTNGTDGLPDGDLLQGTLGPLFWYKLGPNSDEFHLGGTGVGIFDFDQLVEVSGKNQFTVLNGHTTIPEPSTMVLFATGLGILSWSGITRHRKLRAGIPFREP